MKRRTAYEEVEAHLKAMEVPPGTKRYFVMHLDLKGNTFTLLWVGTAPQMSLIKKSLKGLPSATVAFLWTKAEASKIDEAISKGMDARLAPLKRKPRNGKKAS